MTTIGLTCWQRCGNTFDYQISRGQRRDVAERNMEIEAGKVGWVIGHFDGQGHYACPNCSTTVWDPIPLNQQRPR